jgi:hypothetical protein
MRGCQLVVLSACLTARGRSRPGEGVASLRQAYHLAGAESVLATGWSIPEAEQSALVVTDFFAALTEGRTRVEALCHAQRRALARLRASDEPLPRFHWAAYSLTGGPGNPGTVSAAAAAWSGWWLALAAAGLGAVAVAPWWRGRQKRSRILHDLQ